jgi:hypothetical protein
MKNLFLISLLLFFISCGGSGASDSGQAVNTPVNEDTSAELVSCIEPLLTDLDQSTIDAMALLTLEAHRPELINGAACIVELKEDEGYFVKYAGCYLHSSNVTATFADQNFSSGQLSDETKDRIENCQFYANQGWKRVVIGPAFNNVL